MLDEENTNSPIILAMDLNSPAQVLALAKSIDPKFCHLKIGSALFTRSGPGFLEQLMQLGFKIFLDLKFHDIPQTVYGAVRAAADLGVWMVNVHIAGGVAMMEKAREAANTVKKPPILLGVTVLTSLEQADLRNIGIDRTLEEEVITLAEFGKKCGLDGVVCSAHEARLLRKQIGKDFLLVTPGIRLHEDEHADQKRVQTPNGALGAGADFIVIGRSVTQSADPLMTLEKIYTGLQ